MDQLTIRPLVREFVSIVFLDESNILSKSDNLDFEYNELIRPW